VCVCVLYNMVKGRPLEVSKTIFLTGAWVYSLKSYLPNNLPLFLTISVVCVDCTVPRLVHTERRIAKEAAVN